MNKIEKLLKRYHKKRGKVILVVNIIFLSLFSPSIYTPKIGHIMSNKRNNFGKYF